ncbi:hypothetical protein A1O1_06032 [Capronia coronata CBS 617.96]|uniref:RING-type domain-containing protein n=1 Tax=Capronia coronata CBS 617.96 TaxID=1182541 RepID=W9Y8U5_9EURO|nr:uncharacterized protein A1O1_06032 [Capronia coronata CBS 617.96]EXJ85666.1 hypothetical protein A1O1_06032 [Capronia coronata CBS 617.96]
MRDDGVRGALFFRPGNDSGQPPPVSDPAWSLGDGGQWKSANDYPVYALSGAQGASLLQVLALYSGNMSQVPHGKELTQLYDPTDSVRLYADLDLAASNGIPSLWVFLIIVLAILLAVVLAISIVMHVIQRKRRRRLQRRVANGEVDLEALGIKRLNVPPDLVEKMPQYTYTANPEPDSQAEADKSVNAGDKTATGRPAPGPAVHEVHFSQRTCPICLDDFVSGETTVRELPCNHIFHPECIDPFLRNNSSLCPMCKKSALPPGYCPVQVTNLMVRRERLIRRTMPSNVPELPPAEDPDSHPGAFAAFNRRFRRMSVPLAHRTNPYGSAAGGHAAASEMHSIRSNRDPTVDEDMPADIRNQGVSARRAWRRERLARQHGRTYDEQANEARALDVSRPLWRRILGRFFPNLE